MLNFKPVKATHTVRLTYAPPLSPLLPLSPPQPESARQRDRRQKTALHHCADGTGSSCADLLLTSCPELLDATDEDGHTAVHLAVIAGHQPLLKLLLERGADLDRRDHELHSAVHWATGERSTGLLGDHERSTEFTGPLVSGTRGYWVTSEWWARLLGHW